VANRRLLLMYAPVLVFNVMHAFLICIDAIFSHDDGLYALVGGTRKKTMLSGHRKHAENDFVHIG
jgi:hypothetical protein